MDNHHKQNGGTLLGFIFGLIVGLGIALAVAMVVTKSSLPFSNKQGKLEKLSEPTASQAADPNKPLYGNKDAAKEAAKSFTKEDAPKPADMKDDTKAKKNGKDDTNKDVKPDGKKDEKAPINDKAAADHATKADKPDATKRDDKADDKWTYYLQAGAYRDASDAEDARAKLALMGFEARISEVTSQGAPLYRVRLGPFAHIDTMSRVRGKLTDSGIDVSVARIPK